MALKSVLITGCSGGGIGSALVETFQKHEMHVFATARNPSRMSHLEGFRNVTILALDPTSLPSVQAVVEAFKAKTGGKLDYLVNNAGQTIIMPTLDFDIETAEKMFDINVWGLIRVTQEFAPLIIAAKGTIVNISSISTEVRTPWMGEFRRRVCGRAKSHPRYLRRLQSSCYDDYGYPASRIKASRRQGRDSQYWCRKHQNPI